LIFKKHFDVFICDTEESKAIHHTIRYKVYCEELGYEDSERFPDKMEMDEYDKFSIQFIVRYKDTGEYVAAFRLISNQFIKLQIENFCDMDALKNSYEVSRVCILNEIRRNNDENIKKIRSSILMGIVDSASEYCYHNGIKQCYWLITKTLYKLLTIHGLIMYQCGTPIDHKGLRYPYQSNDVDLIYKFPKFLLREGYKYYSQFG